MCESVGSEEEREEPSVVLKKTVCLDTHNEPTQSLANIYRLLFARVNSIAQFELFITRVRVVLVLSCAS